MKKLRKVIFWCHLPTGVICGLVILIMSVTGTLLAFQPQIVRFAERKMRTVRAPEGEAHRLSTQALFAKVREVKPQAKPTGITIEADPSTAATIALGREGVLYINPYTGELLGEGSRGVRSFFQIVTDLHRWLGAQGENRAVGKAITGVCNIAFLWLAITGLYLWWPQKWRWQYLSPVIVFKRKLKGRARDFNWHNVIGFWSSLILILLTTTGMVMSYQWANNLLYRMTGNEPPAPSQGQQSQPKDQQILIPANLDQLWSRAEEQVPNWQSINLRLSPGQGAPITFSINDGTSLNPLGRSQLLLNPMTAAVIKWEPYTGLNLGRRLRMWARVAHTGEAAGLPGQIIAGLASLGGGFLVFTGLALACRRFFAWVGRENHKDTKITKGRKIFQNSSL